MSFKLTIPKAPDLITTGQSSRAPPGTSKMYANFCRELYMQEESPTGSTFPMERDDWIPPTKIPKHPENFCFRCVKDCRPDASSHFLRQCPQIPEKDRNMLERVFEKAMQYTNQPQDTWPKKIEGQTCNTRLMRMVEDFYDLEPAPGGEDRQTNCFEEGQKIEAREPNPEVESGSEPSDKPEPADQLQNFWPVPYVPSGNPMVRAEIGAYQLQALMLLKATRARQEPELPMFRLPRPETQGQKIKAGEPRPENQSQKVMASESSPASRSQDVKAREPRSRSQDQKVKTRESEPEPELDNSRPENQRAKANMSRLGSQGQEVGAKESEPNRADTKKASTRERDKTDPQNKIETNKAKAGFEAGAEEKDKAPEPMSEPEPGSEGPGSR